MKTTRSIHDYGAVRPWLMLVGVALVLAACTSKVDQSQIIIRDHIAYLKGMGEPFTGTVVGKGKEGYRSHVCTFEKQYKDGLLDGRSEYWYMNGKLESMVPYKMGEIHGMVTRYYDNGKIKARIHFVDGLRGGSKGEMFWDQEGNRIKG